ncbi:hypothetical protein C121_94 [Stenotrophomonas phage C121]|uniref:hypothetical protein n=1 Tax=Stenotrophomonas phage C121 TaxID=2914029 RepID=UPI0023299701|nr:hypothetical protein PP752_gp94 [Stenotrophomonas phage C121]UKL14827.1 hypothetical protein C121_94 [Stenotrophomonas phage C121]
MSHVHRLQDEEKQLTKRLSDLKAFMGTSGFDLLEYEEKGLLYQQAYVMQQYLGILMQRLDLIPDYRKK